MFINAVGYVVWFERALAKESEGWKRNYGGGGLDRPGGACPGSGPYLRILPCPWYHEPRSLFVYQGGCGMSISKRAKLDFRFEEDGFFIFEVTTPQFCRLETFALANGIFAFDDAVTILPFGEMRTEGRCPGDH